MKLRVTRREAGDLQELAGYLRERNPQAAGHVRAAILRSLQILMLFPRIGRRQSTEGVRKLITRRYLYVVYYTIDDANEEVVVLTIQHPSRKQPY